MAHLFLRQYTTSKDSELNKVTRQQFSHNMQITPHGMGTILKEADNKNG